MSLVSEFLQKVGLIRNETQYHGNTKERVADTFETLFNLDVWFKKLDSSDPDANKIYQADGTLVDLPEGGLATDMSNLDDDLTAQEQSDIKAKLDIDDAGLYKHDGFDENGNPSSGMRARSKHKTRSSNFGNLGAFAVELSDTDAFQPNAGALGQASFTANFNTTASGRRSAAFNEGTEAKSYLEFAKGRFNESESNHADSYRLWYDDDLIESVGGGTNHYSRLNLFARYKSGAFYWIKKTLSTITNAVKGFHAADEDGRLNYFDGSVWKKYSLEGEGSGGGSGIQNLPTVADQAFFETANSGVYYASDNTVLSDSNFKGFVKVSEWLYDFRTIEVTGWFDNYDYFMSQYYRLNDDGNSTYSLSYLGDALALNNFVPTSIQEQNNQNNLKFWRGSQAEYDAITTKNPQTLYIVSNSGLIGNGVTPTVTASVITNYDIDIVTQTEHWNLTMTGDTDFDFANMFASGNSKVITITLEGDYAFTFPSWLKPLETNDYYDTIGGTLVAEIVINIKNGGTNPSGYYSLQMIDYAV